MMCSVVRNIDFRKYQLTSVIGDVLSLRLFAFDTVGCVGIGERTKAVVLVYDTVGESLEALLAIVGHPRAQLADAIPLYALIVEAMSQLVTSDHPETTVIN